MALSALRLITVGGLLFTTTTASIAAGATGQEGMRQWTRKDGATVSAKLTNVRGYLVSLNLGNRTADISIHLLSEADREIVYGWLLQETMSRSSRRVRPGIELKKKSREVDINLRINGVPQTASRTVVSGEIHVPYFYDSSKLTFRKIESEYNEKVTRKDIQDPSKGDPANPSPLPRREFETILDDLEESLLNLAQPLLWDSENRLVPESSELVNSVIEINQTVGALPFIQRIKNGDEISGIDIGRWGQVTKFEKGDEVWIPTIPRTINRGILATALKKLDEMLATVFDVGAGQGNRQAKWKAAGPELSSVAEFFRQICAPEHTWMLPLETFEISSREIYMEISDGTLVLDNKTVSDGPG